MRNISGLPVFVPQMTWAGLLPSEVAVKVAEWQLVSVASEVRGPGITNSWKLKGESIVGGFRTLPGSPAVAGRCCPRPCRPRGGRGRRPRHCW